MTEAEERTAGDGEYVGRVGLLYDVPRRETERGCDATTISAVSATGRIAVAACGRGRNGNGSHAWQSECEAASTSRAGTTIGT